MSPVQPRLPYPISETWHQCGMCRKGTAEHLDSLLFCHQVTLRTLVAIQLADYVNGSRDKKLDDDLKKHLPRPSDGHWASFLLHLTRHLDQRPEPPFLAECAVWHAGDAKDHITALIELRNKIRHGSSLSGTALQKLTAQIEGHLVALLQSLAWLANYDLVHLYDEVTVQVTGALQGRWQSLSGRDLMNTPFEVQWRITSDTALAQNILYLLNPQRERALALAPWMRLIQTESPRRFYLLSRAHKWKELTLNTHNKDITLDLSKYPDPLLTHLKQSYPEWFARPGSSTLVHLDVLSRDTFPQYQAAAPPPALTRHRSRKGTNASSRRAMWPSAAMLGCLGGALLLMTLGGRWLDSSLWSDAPPKASPEVAHVAHTSPSGLTFARVEPGTFLMGSPETDPHRSTNEQIHEVQLTRPFLMQTTEVTINQWQQVMGRQYPSYKRDCGPNCPVELVSWYDALAFLNRLSEKEGVEACYELRGCNDKANIGAGCPLPPKKGGDHDGWCGVQRDKKDLSSKPYVCKEVVFKGLDCEGYRMPTEAEWEYAARAGDHDPRYGENLDAVAWYGAPSGTKVYPGAKHDTVREYPCPYGAKHPVGQKKPNAWGLYDMLGNVSEWVWDAYGAYPTKPVIDPITPPIRSPPGHQIYRGGSECDESASALRFSHRSRAPGRNRSCMIGFRVARTLED